MNSPSGEPPPPLSLQHARATHVVGLRTPELTRPPAAGIRVGVDAVAYFANRRRHLDLQGVCGSTASGVGWASAVPSSPKPRGAGLLEEHHQVAVTRKAGLRICVRSVLGRLLILLPRVRVGDDERLCVECMYLMATTLEISRMFPDGCIAHSFTYIDAQNPCMT